jgi:uncharacterized membrane protein YeaQ/YmgE (transglycosylase-associated protein family)
MLTWIGMIAIGLIAGWMFDSLTSGGGFGRTASLILGLVGSLIGVVVAEALQEKLVGANAPVFLYALLFAAVGAILLLVIASLINKRL